MDDVDAVSTDSIEESYSTAEKEELFREEDEKISSVAEKILQASRFRNDAQRPRMILHKNGGASADHQSESHGGVGFSGEMDSRGHKEFSFESFRQYQDPKSKSETEIRGSVNVNEKGTVSGKVNVEHRW